MRLIEWSDIMCFGWAIVFLIWGFRFRSDDNGFVKELAKGDNEKRDKLARACSRACFESALCFVVIGIAAIMDWTAVMLAVFFGMVASFLFSVGRDWWEAADETAQNQDGS